MQVKEAVQRVLRRLPDDCSYDDVLYHVYVLQAIARGLADVDAARTMSHEQVARELRERWVIDPAT